MTGPGVTAHISSQTNGQVVVVAGTCPSVCPELGDVVLTSNTESVVRAVDAWKYGRINTVEPQRGQLGTLVTITGQGLTLDGTTVANVQLAGVNVERIVMQNDSYVVVVAGASAATNAAEVTVVSNTGQSVFKAFSWEYLEPSRIDTVSPASGQFGTVVTISGQRFFGGGLTVVRVLLGGYEAQLVNVSDTELVVVANHGAALTGDVVIEADSSARTVLTNGWRQLAAGVVTNVTAPEGRVGTRVLIDGLRLRGGGAAVVQVLLVGVPVEQIVSESDTHVEVISAANTPGQGDVVLVSDTGAIVRAVNGFAYVQPGNISSVVPNNGQLGTLVGIFGVDFYGGGAAIVSVTLANVPAVLLNESSVAVFVRANASAAATGDVVLTADTGATLTLVDGWTYNEPGVVDSVLPSSGQYGTRVTVRGSRLGGGGTIQRVTLAGTTVTIVSANDTLVEVSAGARAAGRGDVVITSDTGSTVISSDAFLYLEEPDVQSINPTEGQDGMRVTVCGSHLLGGGQEFESVYLGTNEALILAQNATCIVFEV